MFLDADNILRKKLKTYETYVFDYKKRKDEAVTQLENLRKYEKINDFGIMEGSYWMITIADATGLKKQNVEDPCNAFIQVQYIEETKRTEVVSGSTSPEWMQKLKL